MALLKNAICGYSPYFVEFVFPDRATHCNIIITTWNGAENKPNDFYDNINLEIRKTELNTGVATRVDISPYLREKLDPRLVWSKVVNRDPDLIQEGCFVFANYSTQFCDNNAGVCLQEGGYQSPTFLVASAYSFAGNKLFEQGTIGDEAPYLFDGSLNEAFALDNSLSAKYRTATEGSVFNFVYDNANTLNIHDTSSLGILYTKKDESFFKRKTCSDYTLFFVDKNGLADWLPVSGKVNRSIEVDKNTYMGAEGLYNGSVNGYTKFLANLGAVDSVMSNKLAELLLSRCVYLYNKNTEEFSRVIVEESEYLLKDFSFKNKNNYTLKLKTSKKLI